MRRQKIVRRVDALPGQGRYLLWLGCQHKISITEQAIMLMSPNQRHMLQHAADYNCPFCPDPPPEAVQAAQTPQQLWKEAGEP